jgi:hypothetical protein
VAILLFLAFADLSLYQAMSGADSCGCFGLLKINPWLTFTLDVVIALGLGRVWIRLRADKSLNRAGVALCNARFRIAIVLALTGLVIVTLPQSLQSARDTSSGDPGAKGSLVVMKPDTWVNKPLILTQYVEISADLTRGEWIVLVYHSDCPKCRDALLKYVCLAELSASKRGAPGIAFVEVPPYRVDEFTLKDAVHGRLRDEYEWFVQTPVEIRLSGGKVRFASLDLPSISRFP